MEGEAVRQFWKRDYQRNLLAKFANIWPSGFRGDFKSIYFYFWLWQPYLNVDRPVKHNQ